MQFPDNGGYTVMKWKDGWHDGLLGQHTRMLANYDLTYNYYWQTQTGQFISLRRTDGLIQKLDASLQDDERGGCEGPGD